MADDYKPKDAVEAPAPRPRGDRGAAGPADKPPAQRPIPPPRTLTRGELEELRSRLQKKFH